MSVRWRAVTSNDLATLAEWNHQLIRDEGHRNPMTVSELAVRMRTWLGGLYQAVIFSRDQEPVGYALYRVEPELIYLRQFFIRRDLRRTGCGRAGFQLLRTEIWPKDVRITVEVLCRNPAGLAFWRSVGCADYCLTLEIMPQA